MRPLAAVLIFLLLAGAYASVYVRGWEQRERVRRESLPGYVLPSGVSRILAIGNKGVLSDYLFLKTMTFFGERFGSGKRPNDEDWEYLEHSLDVITDLDPFFLDPYLFSEGVLAWDAGRIDQANRLLNKGVEARSWEWRLPFYVGFNYFYFQQDYARGSEYVMRAARVEGSPAFLKTLGGRLAYYGRKSKTAILFLRQMLIETRDSGLRSALQKRLAALEAASMIEDAVEAYRMDHVVPPVRIDFLVEAGYLERLPTEPYGGNWIFMQNGRVFSTSRFADTPLSKKETAK